MIREGECFVKWLSNLEMFHKKIKEQTGQLGQLGLIYVPVCPKNTGYVTANVLFCSQHNYSCIFLKGERERNRETEGESGWEGAKERGRETETHFSQEYLNPQVWINKMVIGQSLPPKSFRVTHKNHCGPPRVLSQEYLFVEFYLFSGRKWEEFQISCWTGNMHA